MDPSHPVRTARDLPISPVIDTCVLIDMFDPDSPRHEVAKSLGDWLIANHVKAFMPWTGMFELNRVITRIRKEKPHHQLSLYFNKDRPVVVERLPVDAGFFSKYFRPELPYTKAADMLFLSIAYVDKRPLVTEDKALRRAANEAGVAVFSIEEFINHVKHSPAPPNSATEPAGS